MFGIMQVEEVEEDEGEDEVARELRKKPNPGGELCYKVIVTNENGLQAADPNSIFLIDHAWTCRMAHARQQLQQVPGLLHRMANLMGIEFHGELPSAEAVDLVLEEMWKFNQTYQLAHGTAEEKVPVWYIMDEFGSRIQHADVPSFATAPFFYVPQRVAYTLLWPLRDLDTGEEVTRDFAYGEADPLIRRCVLLPWAPADLRDLSSSTPEPSDEHYQAILEENKEKLPVAINPAVYPCDHVFNTGDTVPGRVVSKYIESPVLFLREDVGRVKFDIRYIVLLRSVKPLTLPFALNDLDDYEKHFTVMNYDPELVLKQMHYDEFVPEFEKQYPEFPWKSVQADIFQAFTELFQVACARPPPLGFCDYPSSRAMYAIDLMLKWDSRPDGKRVMQPQLLEVNFNPDCERACRCYPAFFNDVFST
ncbi:hypothetical protein E2I00_002904, partial [Balaenoptera physalus]